MPPRAERLAYHGPAKMPCQTTERARPFGRRRTGCAISESSRSRTTGRWTHRDNLMICTEPTRRPVLLEHRDLVEVARNNREILVEPVGLATRQAVDLQLLDEAAAGLDRGSDLRLPEVQQVIQRLRFGVIRRQDVARAVAARRRTIPRRLLGDAAAGDQRPFTCGAVGHAPPLAVLELLPRAGGAEQSLRIAQQSERTPRAPSRAG